MSSCSTRARRASPATSATATARYLEASLTGGDVVGISSWSPTLLAAVDAMRPLPPKAGAERALQLFGGVGNPAAEAHAARLTQRFADLRARGPRSCSRPASPTRSTPRGADHRPLRQGGARRPRRGDARAGRDRRARAVEPAAEQRQHLLRARARRARRAGAVGDICLRFFDADGGRVESDVDRRVIGVTLEQLRQPTAPSASPAAPQVRGDPRRPASGGWINVLITDARRPSACSPSRAERAGGRTPTPPRGALIDIPGRSEHPIAITRLTARRWRVS